METKLIHGIRGLAEFLKCGTAKAQQLKDSGKFKVYSMGKRVFFRPEEVINGLEVKHGK